MHICRVNLYHFKKAKLFFVFIIEKLIAVHNSSSPDLYISSSSKDRHGVSD